MKNRIRVERAEVRMTQQQLADAVGVSRQTINAIEAGKFIPSTVLALKIARRFGKPVEEIFQLEEGECPRPRQTKEEAPGSRLRLPLSIRPDRSQGFALADGTAGDARTRGGVRA